MSRPQSRNRKRTSSKGKKESFRDIFLSHRSINKPIVRELAGWIESEQYQGHNLLTWIDEAEIRPGQSVPGMINEGLENSRFIGIVMSPDYFGSETGWTEAEWHAALHTDPDNRRARIIPLLIQDCPYIPYLLRHLRSIDLRQGNFEQGYKELLAVLRDEPLPRPVAHRGQLITPGGKIDRSTLIAERSVPLADPDAVTERLYCNLLPVERTPQYTYTAAITRALIRERKDGRQILPTKDDLKETIRASQEEAGLEQNQRFMPAFRVFEDRIITFHDLEAADNPLAAVIDENDIEVLRTADLVRDEDLRKIVISLMNMALARHLGRAGLVIDDKKKDRFFFPAKDGEPNQIVWTPLKKKAPRTVAKPVSKDDIVQFWRHLGAYVQVVFLVNKFYIKIIPTWVISDDGYRASGGPDIGKRVIKWTGPERNMQVLYHVRFWTSILRSGKRGPISILAGDQILEVATVPALIQQAYGIAEDQKDLLRLLDEEAPIIAEREERMADIALEADLDEEEDSDDELDMEGDFDESEGDFDES